MLNGNIHQRVHVGLGCSCKVEAFAVRRQLLMTPAISLLSVAWLWVVISKQGIVFASSDFSEEERNYKNMVIPS